MDDGLKNKFPTCKLIRHKDRYFFMVYNKKVIKKEKKIPN